MTQLNSVDHRPWWIGLCVVLALAGTGGVLLLGNAMAFDLSYLAVFPWAFLGPFVSGPFTGHFLIGMMILGALQFPIYALVLVMGRDSRRPLRMKCILWIHAGVALGTIGLWCL